MTRIRNPQTAEISPRRFNRPTLEAPNLLMVEGVDEYHFFRFLLTRDDVQIHVYEGKDQLRLELRTLSQVEGFDRVGKIAIVRDADNDPRAAVQSVLGQWANAFNTVAPGVGSDEWFSDDAGRQWCVWMMPAPDEHGDLEELLWRAVGVSAHRDCVERLMECLDACDPIPFTSRTKARLYTWFSTQHDPLKELHAALRAGRNLFNPADTVFARFVGLIDGL